jgi:hypothetical protein
MTTRREFGVSKRHLLICGDLAGCCCRTCNDRAIRESPSIWLFHPAAALFQVSFFAALIVPPANSLGFARSDFPSLYAHYDRMMAREA